MRPVDYVEGFLASRLLFERCPPKCGIARDLLLPYKSAIRSGIRFRPACHLCLLEGQTVKLGTERFAPERAAAARIHSENQCISSAFSLRYVRNLR
jgi:hypothetical protein